MRRVIPFLLFLHTCLAALPYRILLVVNDQWKDPSSIVIEGGDQFNTTAALLKTWGVPFDVLRLDQQRLDAYHLLDREGAPHHGAIIWATGGPAPAGKGAEFLATLVRDHGVSLIILGDSLADPTVSTLAGLTLVSENRLGPPFTVERDHFLTRSLRGHENELMGGNYVAPGYKVETNGAEVLLAHAGVPFLTVRGRALWLGLHRASNQLARQAARDLFKRCLVWALGALVYAEYSRSILIEMHDNGNAEKTISPSWHLQSLSEQQLRDHVIEPARKHGARITQVVNTGFVDRRARRVVNPWKLDRAVDSLDGKTLHDYTSTKRGLDAGHAAGIFEIHSHGWTHFLPDLDSPPGPYWTAPLDGAGSLAWYNEFVDRLRNRDVPAATQRLHMQRSIDYIERDFGVRPLFFRPPGGGNSPSLANHTGRIAAEMGFGLTRFASPYYLGRDLTVQLGPAVTGTTWAYDREYTAKDVPWTVDGPFFLAFHDRDVAKDGGWFARVLTGLGPGVRYMTAGEYVAYLHAAVSRDADRFSVQYDAYYCRYFDKHPSRWVIHRAEGTPEREVIELTPGAGQRRLSR